STYQPRRAAKRTYMCLKTVKQIMEEAVTKKFVHEDSSHIIALCTAIEACLSHLLKRRAAGFLRSDKIAALFTKVGKVYDTAADVCRKVQEQLQQQLDKSARNFREQGSSTTSRPPQPLSAQAIKHIWVRTALFEKVLDKIVQYIVDNSSISLMLINDVLSVGPCALEYTKLKTSDHFWTDPSANELVQRHRIHGAHRGQDTSAGRRPALGIRKRQSSGSMSEDRFAASAREYVESLHQNSRTHLLYGKNNVLVQPKKDMEVLRGYLSLHQAGDNLTLKWTPNQLINGTLGDCDLEKSIYWDYALTVPLRQIVCIHCHQRPDCGGTLVLVSQDGIQRPPLHFPPGGHLLAFLSCLETGLLPRGQLEPPLWSQKGKGKVFPKLRKRSSAARLIDQDRNGEEQTAADYVFRIVYPGYQGGLVVMDDFFFSTSVPLKMLCQNMKRQIVSRAFYGWLAYCRHLSTVRTHLSALVNHNIVPPDRPCEASGGLSKEVWSKYQKDCKNYKELELLRLVYYGGVQHDIRKEVWPFLLGHYKFGMGKKDMNQISERYQQVMREWKACEVIVRQREKEMQSAIFAKLSSGSSIDSHVLRLVHRDSTLTMIYTLSLTNVDSKVFSVQIELLDTVALNLHRIDKDVQRCDRNYYYFTTANLEKLRNIMCSYVWEHLEMGYVQGMCDLLAPLMVILDDECLAYSCFTQLMKRMSQNFPNGGAMDTQFANMRSLIQILDSELFELMQQNGDYTHFYFCYRWFLLDFKRELLYEDVFAVWEVIWVAPRISSKHFVLFLALALVTVYREIIIDNNMDFTDIIKFFNEMAERHDVQHILKIARELVHKVQSLMDNK
uniref:Small G protein signaling modulator 2 n=1 Tax=Sparus aurata TaxID=8175 RepID=A0A671VG07_SPAAU